LTPGELHIIFNNVQEIGMDPKASCSLLAASLLTFSLTGCVHGSTPSIVTVDRGYESVYLALLNDARRCYPASAGAAQREVNGTLDGPAHSGREKWLRSFEHDPG
jgi:hypothetical protein